jgi:DNA ligase D-like protein (predicted 3'-phosphoesterase)
MADDSKGSPPSNPDPLKSYREKRNFDVTAEPLPSSRPADSSGRIFVVQKHFSRSLHYDLRLEAEGVLKSFAVPKGPSMNPSDKRLVIETEDHPLEYASFQGIIPEGQYGAGRVLLWDRGSYRNLSEKDGKEISTAQALKEGHAKFWLDGRKLAGGFALNRTKRGWLLVKMRYEREAEWRMA